MVFIGLALVSLLVLISCQSQQVSPEPKTAKVPNVVGMSPEQADEILERARLYRETNEEGEACLQRVGGPPPQKTVVSQSPSPGATLPTRSTQHPVVLEISCTPAATP